MIKLTTVTTVSRTGSSLTGNRTGVGPKSIGSCPSDTDVLVPQVRVLPNKIRHQLHAVRIVEHLQLNAA